MSVYLLLLVGLLLQIFCQVDNDKSRMERFVDHMVQRSDCGNAEGTVVNCLATPLFLLHFLGLLLQLVCQVDNDNRRDGRLLTPNGHKKYFGNH